jgi:hypothetical protein
MKFVRILGVLLIFASIVLYGVSVYISARVNEGSRKIAHAERNVEQVRGLTELTPYTSDIGNILTDEAQAQIDEKKEEVAEYKGVAIQYKSMAIGLLVLGIALLLGAFIYSINRKE